MNEDKFRRLGKLASDAYANGESLNSAIVKIAQDEGLNANQIARVCEAANLNVYTSKMASADTRRDEFDLADCSEILARLNIKPDPRPVKSANARSIDYFVKSASIDQGSVFAPEYNTDGRFLNKLAKSDEFEITKVAADDRFKQHRQKLAGRKAIVNSIQLKQSIEDLNADLTMAKIKLASAVKQAVALIKQSAMSSNPFTLWRSFDDDAYKAESADLIFTKAAEDISRHNTKLAAELLLEAKSIIPEHDSYINERKVKIINKEPIIKIIDHITNFRRIIDKIEDFKSCDGINERSSTPTGNVAYTSGKEQRALDYYKKLIKDD